MPQLCVSQCQSQGRTSVSPNRTEALLYLPPTCNPFPFPFCLHHPHYNGVNELLGCRQTEQRRSLKAAEQPLRRNLYCPPASPSELAWLPRLVRLMECLNWGREERCCIRCLARVNIMARWPRSCAETLLCRRERQRLSGHTAAQSSTSEHLVETSGRAFILFFQFF